MMTKKHSNLLRLCLITGITALTLSACSGTKWGFPYKAPVQQGNWLTASQIERLEVGMSREQVRFLLGSPTLQDIFHSDRWDYPYFYKPGTGKSEQRLFTVWFDGDYLVRWEGDAMPDRQPYEQFDAGTFKGEKIQSPEEGAFPQSIQIPDGQILPAEPLL